MKLICFTILLIILIDAVLSAQMFGQATVRAGKCYYAKKKLYIAPGEASYISGCKEVVCIKKRNKYYLEINSCGAVEKQCRIPGNPSLPYPECCSQNKCLYEYD